MNCKYWNYNRKIENTFKSEKISKSLLLAINQQRINTKNRDANKIFGIIIPLLHHIYITVKVG